MGIFDPDPKTSLADALGGQADTLSLGITDDYAKKRRKSVSEQAALGRLGSGVSNYQAGDLAAGELTDLGGVQSSLAGALGDIPSNDFLLQEDNKRKLELAKLIGELNQSGGGTLGGVTGGLSGALGGAATGFSVGGPWGALIGGAAGGALGGYGGSQKRRTA